MKNIIFTIIGIFVLCSVINAQPTQEIQKILANDGADYDNYGYSVSISGDYAVIGAYEDDDNGSRSGSAYVYYNNAGNWELKNKFTGSSANNHFGYSVNILGNYFIIGEPGNDRAYIYQLVSDNWQKVKTLVRWNAYGNDKFGIAVSISNNCAVVGSENLDTDSYYSSVFVYKNNSTCAIKICKNTDIEYILFICSSYVIYNMLNIRQYIILM